MSKSTTAKDVARAAEVSVVTVSRVLNNHANVTENVRQRVLQAANKLGYVGRISSNGLNGLNGHTSAPRKHQLLLKDVGFLFDTHVNDDSAGTNPFWSHILSGVETEARNWGIKMSYRAIAGLGRSPQALLGTIRDMRLNGILLVGTAQHDVVVLIQSTGLPFVLVDNHVPSCAVDSVLSDNVEGARQAVKYLISAGHTRIAFLGGPTLPGPGPINLVYTVEQRIMGYWAALRETGLPIDDRLFESSNMTTSGAYESCKRLLARCDDFSAILCANDESAIGAIKALREAGRRVPEDVSIIGFDDIDMAEHLTPALTTVRIHKRAIGATSVKTLITRANDPSAMPVTILLPTELIKRDSVAAFPHWIDREHRIA